MGLIREGIEGVALQLMSLFGGDVSPRRPGEPDERDPTAYLAQFGTDHQYDAQRTAGLYPRLSHHDLLKLMSDMDSTDIAASVLDMLSEDATAYDNDEGTALMIEGMPAVVREIKELSRTLKWETRLHPDCREMCKWGDHFTRLIYSPEDGVTNMVRSDPFDLSIELNRNTREVVGFRERGHVFRDRRDPVSYPWDYGRFKLTGRDTFEPYGTPALAAGIRPWTQMSMAEDKALMYRIQRQPDRLVFKIDVGSASESEAWKTIQAYRRSVNRKVAVDPVMQRLRQEHNPLGALENYYLGVRPNSSTDVSMLNGSQNVQDVTDLLYFLKKFLTSVRVPPPIFGIQPDQGDDYRRNKKLTNQDVRYARHVKRIQSCLCEGYRMIGLIHLRLRAKNVEDPRLLYDGDEKGKNPLTVRLRPPSFLEELERLEVQTLRMQLASEMSGMASSNPAVEPYEWTLHIMRQVLRLPDEVVKRVTQEPPPPDTGLDGEGGGGAPQARPKPKPSRSLPSASERGKTDASASSGLLAGNTPLDPTPKEADAVWYTRTNGGVLNEEQVARLAALVKDRPALRQQLARVATLFEEDNALEAR